MADDKQLGGASDAPPVFLGLREALKKLDWPEIKASFKEYDWHFFPARASSFAGIIEICGQFLAWVNLNLKYKNAIFWYY